MQLRVLIYKHLCQNHQVIEPKQNKSRAMFRNGCQSTVQVAYIKTDMGVFSARRPLATRLFCPSVADVGGFWSAGEGVHDPGRQCALPWGSQLPPLHPTVWAV